MALLLGGAGSGKSEAGERLARTLPPPVTYVATWVPACDDADMQARVAAHRARRPPEWAVREVGQGLVEAVLEIEGTAIVDSLGTWVANAPGFGVDGAALADALRRRNGDTVVVSDEAGLGVHPSSESGRRFRDALGSVNQEVSAVADAAWLVVAGRLLALDRPASWEG
jgi:adenosylcobinamide kinase/adenosylcobinamide-phosphate guanylyltransferase